MADAASERILKILDEVNAVPRQSEHTGKIHPWLMNWAETHGFEADTDEFKNIVIRVPASPGCENAPIVVIQGHMDMVCEKRPDVIHNFQEDPIISRREGDWLSAEGTSLGADNGIALAMAFDAALNSELPHPPLEILITADEEIGLVGAQNLGADFIKGRILVNLDSEDDGVFTVGCAGGMDTHMRFPVRYEDVPAGYVVKKLHAASMEGGHSGVEIHKQKANAIVVLTRVLREVSQAVPGMRFGSLHGGTAHNAIPRDARVFVALPEGSVEDASAVITGLEAALRSEFGSIEPNLSLSLCNPNPGDSDEAGLEFGCFTAESGGRLLNILRLIPHGVKGMSTVFEDVVETSLNLAVVRSEKDQVLINTSQRSAVTSRGDDFTDTLFSLTALGGGTCELANAYPPWEPSAQSDILERGKRVWKELSGEDAIVEVIHAGLECGIIGAKYPGIDMISFGPTILGAHSPNERLNIPSLERTNKFFLELLADYCR